MRRHRIAAARFFSRRIWRVAPEPAPALAVLGRGLGGIGARAAPVWGRLFGATAGYVVDADLRFVTVSPEALRAWGKAAEEVLGRRILEVFPAGSLDSYRAHLEALKTSRAMRLRVTSRILGRPVDVAIRPICDGLRVQFAVAA
jgi:PAS domain S-box-containing protein